MSRFVTLVANKTKGYKSTSPAQSHSICVYVLCKGAPVSLLFCIARLPKPAFTNLKPRPTFWLMTYIELFGFTAALMTSLSFLPQAIMIIRTGVTSGISLTMYTMLTSGKVLWLSYGILVTSWPLIFSNIVTLSLASIILTMTARNRIAKPRNISPRVS